MCYLNSTSDKKLPLLIWFITHAPWPQLSQVEQDLIICRALVDMYSRKTSCKAVEAMHEYN